MSIIRVKKQNYDLSKMSYQFAKKLDVVKEWEAVNGKYVKPVKEAPKVEEVKEDKKDNKGAK